MAEIQTKRQERKRRSTANPAYSLFDPEVALKLTCTTYLFVLSHLETTKRTYMIIERWLGLAKNDLLNNVKTICK